MVKFLQNVTKDVELNRVQNNVAEAFRSIEDSIAQSIVNINTNIFNALNITTAGTPSDWDAVSRHTVMTPTDAYVRMASFEIGANSIQHWFVTTIGIPVDFSTSGVFQYTSGIAVPFSNSDGGVTTQYAAQANQWIFGGTAANVQFSVSGTSGVISVRGRINVPTFWRSIIRRMGTLI